MPLRARLDLAGTKIGVNGFTDSVGHSLEHPSVSDNRLSRDVAVGLGTENCGQTAIFPGIAIPAHWNLSQHGRANFLKREVLALCRRFIQLLYAIRFEPSRADNVDQYIIGATSRAKVFVMPTTPRRNVFESIKLSIASLTEDEVEFSILPQRIFFM